MMSIAKSGTLEKAAPTFLAISRTSSSTPHCLCFAPFWMATFAASRTASDEAKSGVRKAIRNKLANHAVSVPFAIGGAVLFSNDPRKYSDVSQACHWAAIGNVYQGAIAVHFNAYIESITERVVKYPVTFDSVDSFIRDGIFGPPFDGSRKIGANKEDFSEYLRWLFKDIQTGRQDVGEVTMFCFVVTPSRGIRWSCGMSIAELLPDVGPIPTPARQSKKVRRQN